MEQRRAKLIITSGALKPVVLLALQYSLVKIKLFAGTRMFSKLWAMGFPPASCPPQGLFR